MIRNSVKPSRAEIIGGGIYLGISQQVLPLLLTLLVLIPGIGMSETGVNILFFLINFVTVVFLFRNFLWVTLLNVRRRISLILWYALLAILGNQVLSELIYALIMLLAPDFARQLSPVFTGGTGSASHTEVQPATKEMFFFGKVNSGAFVRHLWHRSVSCLLSMRWHSTHLGGYKI